MQRLLRGLLTVGVFGPDKEDACANWKAFQEARLDFSHEEDRKIAGYFTDHYGQLSAPPDYLLVREYFEKSDDVEVVTRLEEVSKASLYTHTNYRSIVQSVLAEQARKASIMMYREAAKIVEFGSNFEKPIDGRKSLRGPADAQIFIDHQIKKMHIGGTTDGWNLQGPSSLADEIEPVKLLMEHFRLAEGRPNVLVGYAGSAKTFMAIELAIACASGHKTCWGGLELSTHGPVVHLDYEMGRKALIRRYQRIAHGMGVDLRNIRGRKKPQGMKAVIEEGMQKAAHSLLRHNGADDPKNEEVRKFAEKEFSDNEELLQWECFPRNTLHSKNAEYTITKLCKGKTLLIIDSFRASTAGSGVDENSSEMRAYLDMLSKVSDATGCIVVVLHHSRKDGDATKDKDKTPKIQTMRGSSGLADAVGATVHVVMDDDKGILVEQGKVSMGKRGSSFYLKLQDCGDPNLAWKDWAGIQLNLSGDQAKVKGAEDVDLVRSVILAGGIKTIRNLYEECALKGLGSHPRIDSALRNLSVAKNKNGFMVIQTMDDMLDQ